MENSLVGRTPWCKTSDSVPVVGDLINVELEKIHFLKPSHVLIQKSEAGSDLKKLSKELNFEILKMPINNVSDAAIVCEKLSSILPLDDTSKLKGVTLSNEIKECIQSVKIPGTENLGKGLILNLSVTNFLSWGRKTYLGEMLEARGVSLIHHDQAWIAITIEEIFHLNPEWIIIVGEQDEEVARVLREINLNAWQSGRLIHLIHPDINRPSSNLPEISKVIDEVLVKLIANLDRSSI